MALGSWTPRRTTISPYRRDRAALDGPVLWCGSAGLARRAVQDRGGLLRPPWSGRCSAFSAPIRPSPPASSPPAARLAQAAGRRPAQRGHAGRAAGQARPRAGESRPAGRPDPARGRPAHRPRARSRAQRLPPPGTLIVAGGETLRGLCVALGRDGARASTARSCPACRARSCAAALGRRRRRLEIRRLRRAQPLARSARPATASLRRRPNHDAAHLAITMGDPAGIGPEIIVKACAAAAGPARGRASCGCWSSAAAPRWSGARAQLGRELAIPEVAGRATPTGRRWPACRPGRRASRSVPGVLSADGGRFAYLAIERGVRLAQAGRIGGIVTAPLNKEALNKAGYHYPGHTEMLAELTGVRGSVMMLAHGNMRVSHVTTHVALEDVPKRLTPERLRRVIDLTHEALRRSRHRARRGSPSRRSIPHAGEGGLFGRQDIDVSAADDRAAPSPTGSTWSARSRATRSSSSCAPASTTRWSPCTTTRATSRSSCWASRSIRRPASWEALSRRQHHARPADHPHLGRSRHRLRHRRQGHRQRAQPDRGDRLRRAAGRRPAPRARLPEEQDVTDERPARARSRSSARAASSSARARSPTVGRWADGEGHPARRWWSPTPSMRHASTCSACPASVTVFGEVKPEPDIPNLEQALGARRARAAGPRGRLRRRQRHGPRQAGRLSCPAAGRRIHEVVGPEKVAGRRVALVQVPTTSGTGSEAGTRALVTDPATQNKLAVQSRHMLADLAVIDPDLTLTVPPRGHRRDRRGRPGALRRGLHQPQGASADRPLCAGGHPPGRPLSRPRRRATAATARRGPACRSPRSMAASASAR